MSSGDPSAKALRASSLRVMSSGTGPWTRIRSSGRYAKGSAMSSLPRHDEAFQSSVIAAHAVWPLSPWVS